MIFLFPFHSHEQQGLSLSILSLMNSGRTPSLISQNLNKFQFAIDLTFRDLILSHMHTRFFDKEGPSLWSDDIIHGQELDRGEGEEIDSFAMWVVRL